MNNDRYWEIRAEKFNRLNWVNNPKFMRELMHFSQFEPDDVVLDVGCGTGILSKAVKSLVYKVAAMDSSPAMLSKFSFNESGIVPFCYDIETPFKEFENCFNKIIGRMSFHHLEDIEKGLSNCKEMLTQNGSMIIQEGIPPSETAEVVSWFTHMMAIKEKRKVFTESSLRALFEKMNFTDIGVQILVDSEFSVLNWLRNSGQDPYLLKRVYQAHKTAPESIKELYKMRDDKDGDIIIETKSILIKGRKA